VSRSAAQRRWTQREAWREEKKRKGREDRDGDSYLASLKSRLKKTKLSRMAAVYVRALIGGLSPSRRSTVTRPASEFYSLSAKTIVGDNFSFSQLAGRVVLIVNVASM
jgi:hypothetical protein